jgi:integrase
MANSKGTRKGFGNVRRLPSGRWQARYTGPDARTHQGHVTFDTKGDAEQWLSTVRADIVREVWTPPTAAAAPQVRALTFGAYSATWLQARKVRGRPLADRTREHYQSLLERFLLPTFADVPLRYITPELVDEWYEHTAVETPTYRAHAYGLLRTILGTAVDRGLIRTANPAKVRGGGSTERVRKVRPASLAELETIASEVPERYRLMVLLAAWCALRFGELAELRRFDVDTKHGVIRVRRGVVRTSTGRKVKEPKSDAGSRDVAIPPHLLPLVREHLLAHAEQGRDGLLFPARNGGQLAPSSLYRVYYPARKAAGREDLAFHHLRHTGAVLAAQTGATLAELMARLGHSTPGAAMRYQHAAQERDVEIARRLSALVGGVE